MRHLRLALLLSCIVLSLAVIGAACGGPPKAPVAEPKSIAIPRNSPVPTDTPLPTSTATPSATWTPTASPTASRTSTPTATPLEPGAEKATWRDPGELNLRLGPGLNYPVAGRAKTGAQFSVLGRSADAAWLQVQDASGTELWIFADAVATDHPPTAWAVVLSPRPPAEYVVGDSVADFSAEQGKNSWRYAASRSPGSLNFDLMPPDGRSYRWPNTTGRNPSMRLSEDGSYPSRASDVMRIWTSVYTGTIRIEGGYNKEPGAGRGGNGVTVRVVLRRPRPDGSAEFEQELGRWQLGAYDTQGARFMIRPFEIASRDEIYFITSANGDDNADNTIFAGRIILVNQGGIVFTPTVTPTPLPTSTPVPPLCYAPQLRHFEPHRGCCGEVVGIVYPDGASLRNYAVHIEGPPAGDQYRREFGVAADGGYEITALTWFPPESIYYTIWLVGPNVRSEKYVVRFKTDQQTRAVVDFRRVPCY
jgi:uncharacterized protein YraI